jgi:hypothetical protein
MVTIQFNSDIPIFEDLPWYKRVLFALGLIERKRIWFWSFADDTVHVHPDNLEYLIPYLRSKGLQYKVAKPVRAADDTAKK